ncbi:hypothetical protein RintRC_0986 [Richelia intracellularis]|nr:hypothetical protein RintRC_0986 [Richelia intracellularis]
MRDDFTKFSTIFQWFQTLIHPALMQRRIQLCHLDCGQVSASPVQNCCPTLFPKF